MQYYNELKNNWLLLVFIVSVFVLSSFQVGPGTIRVYAVILMMLHLFFSYNKISQNVTVPISLWYIKIYSAFLIIMFTCLIINGELMEYGYFRRLFAYHLPCFVTFFAVSCKVNTKDQIRIVASLLCVIVVLDGLITVLQGDGNTLAWGIGELVSPLGGVDNKSESYDTYIGHSVTPGIFGNVVRNAYYLCSFFPLVLVYYSKMYSYRIKGLSLLALAISLFAVFITQQRTAFYLVLASLGAFWALRVVKKPIFMILVFALLLLFMSSIETIINSIDYGRLLEAHDDSRENIWQVAFDFIPDNWLVGAPMEFQRRVGVSAHNLAIDGIIFSGIGGFITLMLFVYKSLKLSINGCLGYIKGHYGNMTMVLSLAFFSCIMYGFAHNTSVLTGEPCIFLLLGLLLKSIELDRLNIND